MELCLTCNNLKCRRELGNRALVTTCSHIFCVECAQHLGMATDRDPNKPRCCPACNSQLPNPNDAIISDLNPGEDYKTNVLSGLSPNIIMECAGRALSFWAYQTTQNTCYQQYLYKTLTEKYTNLNTRLEKTVNDANSEIEGLQQQLTDLAADHDRLRHKNEEFARVYREKSRKLLHTQELYDKFKRKAEMGQIQRAASDAVDLSIQSPHTAQTFGGVGVAIHDSIDSGIIPAFGRNQRGDDVSMSTGLARAQGSICRAEIGRWPQVGRASNNELLTSSARGYRHSDVSGSSLPFESSALHSRPTASRPSLSMAGHSMAPNMASISASRNGLSGGFTSGLKSSLPANPPGLGVSARST